MNWNWFMLASGALNFGAACWAARVGDWRFALIYGSWALSNFLLAVGEVRVKL